MPGPKVVVMGSGIGAKAILSGYNSKIDIKIWGESDKSCQKRRLIQAFNYLLTHCYN